MNEKNNLSKSLFLAALRTDFLLFLQKSFTIVDNSQEFVSNWHLELIADKLQECAKGNIKRLIINLPPRSLKSQTISIAFTAWLLGLNPGNRILNISYSIDLAAKLSRSTKQLMLSELYRSIFPNTILSPNKQTETMFETTKNGYRYATTVGGTLTGMGGNYIIIDDPIKAADANSVTIRNSINEWYNNTLISRLDNKKDGVIILVMQRLHMQDLTGHLLKQSGWEVVSLPAIAMQDEHFLLSNGNVVGRKVGEALNPKLESLEDLNNLKLTMNSYNFSAQYQQNPIPEKGNIIDFDKFKYYDNLPQNCDIVQSWDIAFKTGINNDYSVCITAAKCQNRIYIVDILRKKYAIQDLPVIITSLSRTYNCENVIIERTTSTELLINEIQKYGINPIGYIPRISKIERANNIAFTLARGEILLPKNMAWLEDFKTEIIKFPEGQHDDQVDALTQLINFIKEREMNSLKNLEIAHSLKEYVHSEEYLVKSYMRYKALGLGRLF